MSQFPIVDEIIDRLKKDGWEGDKASILSAICSIVIDRWQEQLEEKKDWESATPENWKWRHLGSRTEGTDGEYVAQFPSDPYMHGIMNISRNGVDVYKDHGLWSKQKVQKAVEELRSKVGTAEKVG